MTKVKGFVTVSGITLADGSVISTQQAVDYGWIKPAPGRQPSGWGLEKHEVPIGENLFLDNGRQMLCYLMGFRAPIQDYACQKFGVGTGTTAANVTDVALEAPALLANGAYTKGIDTIDFLNAFVVRVALTLGLSDANNKLITEFGLYTGNDTLIARKVKAVSLAKTDQYSPSFLWRIRF